ncbi:MAG: hypothetical protein HQM14_06155 [SAR324 cluster bacterium]|nr:hypothetical protein [SAR324 cluster bacterium]
MVAQKYIKIVLFFVVFCFFSGFLCAQSRRIETSNEVKKNQLYYQHIDNYKLRLLEARKLRKQKLLSQKYSNYVDEYKSRQKRAAEIKKLQEGSTSPEQGKKQIVKNEQKKQQKEIQRLAGQQRLQRNKEILEGKRDPIVQDDPNYLKYIEKKTQTTR